MPELGLNDKIALAAGLNGQLKSCRLYIFSIASLNVFLPDL